jgi:glycolate oxidase FAD binding subunit
MMMDTGTETEMGRLAVSLEEAIGTENVTRFPDMQIDGLRPALLVMPETKSETACCLEICSRSGARVIPAGMMRWLECGNPVRSADVVVSLCRMNKVVDYSPADLTIWAEAGMTMSDLKRTTTKENQWLPLDPPGRGTLGAVVACASSGPLRFGYGTPRDYVIGLRLAHVDGTETKSGGRVVKNVAGYDLNKLYIGSFGTLAVITEVIVKLRPLPETSTTVVATGPTQSIQSLASSVMSSRLRPASLFILNQAMSSRLGLATRGGAMLARFIECEAAVADQVDRLRELNKGLDCSLTKADDADEDMWPRIADIDAGEAVALKCSVAISRTSQALEVCEKQFPECAASADIGIGMVRVSIGRSDLEVVGRVKLLRSEVESMGGTLIIEHAPSFIRLEADAWGDPGPEIEIMRAIKHKYDPDYLLSPGRFVSGI